MKKINSAIALLLAATMLMASCKTEDIEETGSSESSVETEGSAVETTEDDGFDGAEGGSHMRE